MTAVLFKFSHPDGSPVADTEFSITARKPGFQEDLPDQGIIIPDVLVRTTDAQGEATVNLLPIEMSYYLTMDLGRAQDEDGCVAGFRYRFRVPDSATPVDITDLVVTDPTWSQPWDEKALGIIIEAKVVAVDAAEAAKLSAQEAAATAATIATDKVEIEQFAIRAEAGAVQSRNSADASLAYASQAAASAQETDADRLATKDSQRQAKASEDIAVAAGIVANQAMDAAQASATGAATHAHDASLSMADAAASKAAAEAAAAAAVPAAVSATASAGAAATSETNAAASAAQAANSAAGVATLRTDLATKNDPLKGSGLMGHRNRTAFEKFSDSLNVRDFITSTVNGTTSNQAGIDLALAEADRLKVDLEWPAGTYVSDTNNPLFHKVRNFGRGVIKRGTYTFTIQARGKSTAVSNLYVATDGNASNDGLTPDMPMAAIQTAFDAMLNAGDFLCGRWSTILAAGRYNQAATLDSLGFRQRFVLRGPEANGEVPTAQIDGTTISATNLSGITFLSGIYAQVKDISFENWTGASGVGAGGANTGLNATDRCNVWADNCDFVNCDTGFGSTNSRVYQGRGRVTDCAIGSTAFASTQCSYGYGGPTTYTRVTSVAVNIRDSSSGVVDAGIFNNCNISIRVQYGSVARVSNCTFNNSTSADVYCYTGGSVFFGENNVYTPGRKFRGQNSLDLGNAGQIYFDGDAGTTGRFNFGAVITPNYKFHFREETQNSFASNAAPVCIESPNPQIAMNGPAGGYCGLQYAVPGVAAAASLLYTHVDGNWRVRCNNVDAWRFFSTNFRPVTDNTSTIGLAAARPSTIFAATGTINTSDAREKTEVRPLTDKEMEAAKLLVKEIGLYKWLASVAEKGEEAREHCGMTVQRAIQIMEGCGLDPFKYSFICFDAWDDEFEMDQGVYVMHPDEDGEMHSVEVEAPKPVLVRAKGSRFSFRESGLQMFMMRGLEQRLSDIEARL